MVTDCFLFTPPPAGIGEYDILLCLYAPNYRSLSVATRLRSQTTRLSSPWRLLGSTCSTSSLHHSHTRSYSTTIWCAIRGSWRTRSSWRFSAACVRSLRWHSRLYPGFKLKSWGIRSFMTAQTSMVTFTWSRQFHCECHLMTDDPHADFIR